MWQPNPPSHRGTELHISSVAPPFAFSKSKFVITSFLSFKLFNDFFIVLIVSIIPTLVKVFGFPFFENLNTKHAQISLLKSTLKLSQKTFTPLD